MPAPEACAVSCCASHTIGFADQPLCSTPMSATPAGCSRVLRMRHALVRPQGQMALAVRLSSWSMAPAMLRAAAYSAVARVTRDVLRRCTDCLHAPANIRGARAGVSRLTGLGAHRVTAAAHRRLAIDATPPYARGVRRLRSHLCVLSSRIPLSRMRVPRECSQPICAANPPGLRLVYLTPVRPPATRGGRQGHSCRPWHESRSPHRFP